MIGRSCAMPVFIRSLSKVSGRGRRGSNGFGLEVGEVEVLDLDDNAGAVALGELDPAAAGHVREFGLEEDGGRCGVGLVSWPAGGQQFTLKKTRINIFIL